MTDVVTAAEMRAMDERTIHGLGVPGVVLMENAGRGVVEVMRGLGLVAGRRVVVIAGPGNNGGDGYVIARWLHHLGALVTVIRCADESQVRGDARVHHDAAQRAGVRLVDGSAAAFAQAAPLLDGAEVIVDALFGTGTARPLAGHFAEAVRRINAARAMRIAVDLPSGIDADTGATLGVAVAADHTVTFALPKIGLVGAPGFLAVGRLHVVDIGIPPRIAREVGAHAVLLDEECLAPLRRPRSRTAHKGSFGHLLVVAGARGKTGAALLCGEAAARAGAGLVTIASSDETQEALQARVVEVMTAALGPEPLDAGVAGGRLEALLDGKRAVAFGPGVGREPGMRALLGRLLDEWRGPLVLDADGLNLLADEPALLDQLGAAQAVLTPHPAEMARLVAGTTEAVQADRVAAARAFATSRRAVLVLKGARTVVAAPDGRVAINPTGNPGMASGGTGDVLTGVVGALLAAGLAPFDAACAAVYLHGAAGDRAAAERGETGLLARDLIEALPRAIRGG